MRIAIIGASGFVGRHLTRQLLETTSHELTLFSHKASKLHYTPVQERRLTHIDGNVLQPHDIERALQDCHVAIYLVHLMGSGSDFITQEKQAANNFAAAVNAQSIKRVIYVGGMGDAAGNLTKHLQSRANTTAIIRAQVPQLIELRTPMIVGPGGAGFEVLAWLVRWLPVLPVPKWAQATTQPITIHDVVRYVVAALTVRTSQHQSIDIGGPEQLSYVQLAQRYAAYRHRRLITVPLPFVPKSWVQAVLRLFRKSSHALTVADMIDSAGYSTVITDSKVRQLFPDITPEPVENGFI